MLGPLGVGGGESDEGDHCFKEVGCWFWVLAKKGDGMKNMIMCLYGGLGFIDEDGGDEFGVCLQGVFYERSRSVRLRHAAGDLYAFCRLRSFGDPFASALRYDSSGIYMLEILHALISLI